MSRRYKILQHNLATVPQIVKDISRNANEKLVLRTLLWRNIDIARYMWELLYFACFLLCCIHLKPILIQLLEWLSYLDIFFFVFFVYDIVSYVLSPKTTYEKSHALTVVCKNRLNCYTYFWVKNKYRLPASRDKTRLCAAKIILNFWLFCCFERC